METESRPRRGWDVDIPRRRGRGHAAAATRRGAARRCVGGRYTEPSNSTALVVVDGAGNFDLAGKLGVRQAFAAVRSVIRGVFSGLARLGGLFRRG